MRDLPELMGPEIRVREYETVPEERTEGNPLGLYCLTPERVRQLSVGELGAKRLAAEAARGARFRELYARLDLRAAVGADDTLEITVAATNTKGAMPWDEPSSPSTTSTPT